MRIDKLFSSLGLLSRSECKKAVKAGQIKINDRVISSSDEQADPDRDVILYKGTPVSCARFVYYMLNKPGGVVTAKEDSVNDTVFKYIQDNRPDLAAVGRLDKDTTGLLLITNDGQLNHRLLSAKYHVPKTYIAAVEGNVTDSELEPLRCGMDIGDDSPTLPAEAQLIGCCPEGSIVSLTIEEGRYHQVKRMLSKIGHPVLTLHRKSFGPLLLDPALKPGEVRALTPAEIESLNRAGGIS